MTVPRNSSAPMRRLTRPSARGVLLLLLGALPAAAQNQIWLEQLGTAEDDRALTAAPDGAGGTYVGGYTRGRLGAPNAGGDDAWIARYSVSGSRLWIRQLGTSSSDWAQAAAADGSGGVFVAGYTGGDLGGPTAGSSDTWLARYDGAGNQLWIRQPGMFGVDKASAAAPDGSGGVYLCGENRTGPGGQDFWLARHDSAGDQLWIRLLGTGAGDWAWTVVSDTVGGVYVGGHTEGSLGGTSAGGYDAWLARYDGTGNLQWVRQLGTVEYDDLNAAAPDGAGGVIVCGKSAGDLGGPNAGSMSLDPWLARYDSAGNQIWIRQLGTDKTEYTITASPDGVGGVYVSGGTYGDLGGQNAGNNSLDTWLARYDGAGTQLWTHQLGTSATDWPAGSASDGGSGLFLVGYTSGDLGGASAGSYDAWLTYFDASCAPTSNFCSASTSSIPACQAAIASLGTPTLGDPTDFRISSGLVPGGKVGICFFGDNGRTSVPFGTLGGQICVQPPVRRTKPKLSGGSSTACDGELAFTLQDLIDTSPIVVAGAVLDAQIWARDPANPDGFLLSDGLEFTVCP